jgi:hypothetical protein
MLCQWSCGGKCRNNNWILPGLPNDLKTIARFGDDDPNDFQSCEGLCLLEQVLALLDHSLHDLRNAFLTISD